MNDSKRYYLPKLFGGPQHGKRIAISNPLAPVQYVAQLNGPPSYIYDNGGPTTIDINEIAYTRRDFQFGQRRVHAYVIQSATNERALEMVCNYLLRTAIPC